MVSIRFCYIDEIVRNEENMEPKDYIVTDISGEYATLTDIATDDTLFIAMALLPFGTDIGTKLHYEMLEYTIEG